MKIFLTIALAFVLVPAFVLGAPSVTNVSGTVEHGQNITISGNSFGAKSPAAPLIWDDGEDKTTDVHSAVTGEGEWTEALPDNAQESPNGNEEFNIKYRNANYRNVLAPHSRSTKFLAGGHKDHGKVFGSCDSESDSNNGYNVGVTVPTTSNIIFSTWYYRVDPLYPANTESCAPNHKIDSKNQGPHMYDHDTGDDEYINYTNSNDPRVEGNNVYLRMKYNSVCGGSGNPRLNALNNPRLQWVRIELREKFGAADGFAQLLTDNTYSVNYTNCNWGSDAMGIQSYSIGGFYRYDYFVDEGCGCFEGGTKTHDDAWRYFDDIYIDTTMARVMLANNSTYANATIIEPQIPTIWDATGDEISVSVNFGALTGENAYLFVCDSENSCNATGYPVTLNGEPDVTPPAAPTGLQIL